jgi:hypothetical protein
MILRYPRTDSARNSQVARFYFFVASEEAMFVFFGGVQFCDIAKSGEDFGQIWLPASQK